MNINAEKSPRQCPKCGMTKMQIEGNMACPNCSTSGEPSTGRTMIVTEQGGEKGPVKIEFVANGALPHQAAQVQVHMLAPKPGTIPVNVPVQLLPEFLLWARKLKLPKDWKDAAKIKAIVDFQDDLNKKLEELSK